MSNRNTNTNKVNPTTKKKVVRKGKKKKIDKASLIILVTVIVLGIPAIIVGYELISAQLGTHSPVIGERFDNDLNPKIDKDQLESVKSAVSSIDGVDNATVECATSTLRIYLDCSDSSDDATIKDAVNQAYGKVTSTLDVGTYFTLQGETKMYDIEIHAYNNIDYSKEGSSNQYIYYILNKSSSMEEPYVQLVSQPLNPELAQSLREDDLPEEGSDEGDMTVGGADDMEQPAPTDGLENPTE